MLFYATKLANSYGTAQQGQASMLLQQLFGDAAFACGCGEVWRP
jgi:hypothetical protein